MHELHITESILRIALGAARDNGARRVTAIDLVLGELSSVVDDSVQFYFDALSRGTPAEGAALRFRRVPAEARCWDCEHVWPVRAPLPESCPRCGGLRLRVSGGQEFLVESVDVD
ncbi:MAG: hydrogenase maturation nickel metallochaperone HypA [Chloroflexota bacterium]|jgi:hydrogenase nickel incorporation protein HypA/HybF